MPLGYLLRPAGAINSHQGFWGFLALTYASPKMNQLEYFADGGLLYFGLIPRRPMMKIGLFARGGQFSGDLATAQRESNEPAMTHEAIVEATMYNVTPSFTLQPDVQGVLRPDGAGFISDAWSWRCK